MSITNASGQKAELVSGNLLFFYVIDIGEDINLDLVKEKHFVNVIDVPLSPFFKNYHIPLPFIMPHDRDSDAHCIYRKLYSFGVLSLCYRVPFEASFDNLKVKMIENKRKFDKFVDSEAREIFDIITPAITEPTFFNLKHTYSAVQVKPLLNKMTPDEFKETYGARIASLLKFEMQGLSDYQMDEILASTTGYYGQDLIIIDSDAAFIYDEEYFEPIEFIESANIEKLELQYFDKVLDLKLHKFYVQESHRLPLRAYIPLITEHLNLPIFHLAKLRVDISVVTERLENCINLTGDAYFSKLYSMLVQKLLLKEWRESINKKLYIIKDLYTVHQDRLDTLHDGILMLIIIVFMMLEVFMLMK